MEKCWSPYASNLFGRCDVASESTIARIVKGVSPWQHFGERPCSVQPGKTVLNATCSGDTGADDGPKVLDYYHGVQNVLAIKWRLATSIFSNFEPKYLDDDDLAFDALGYKFLHFRRRSLGGRDLGYWLASYTLRNARTKMNALPSTMIPR